MSTGIIDNFEIINIQYKESTLFVCSFTTNRLQHMVAKGSFIQYLGKGIQFVAAKKLFISLQDNMLFVECVFQIHFIHHTLQIIAFFLLSCLSIETIGFQQMEK